MRRGIRFFAAVHVDCHFRLNSCKQKDARAQYVLLFVSKRCILPVVSFFENKQVNGETVKPRQVYEFLVRLFEGELSVSLALF